MMKIEKNDFIILSDNVKYLVVSKVKYQDLIYYCIVDILCNSNIKIVTIDYNDIIEVNDNKLLDKLLRLISIDIQKELI